MQCKIVELVVSPIVEKVEAEKEMTANLCVSFYERRQKRLNEAIKVGFLTKKQKTGDKKGSSSKLVTTPQASILLSPSIPKAQDVVSISFHGLGETITISSNDSTPSAQISLAAPTDVLCREKLDILLERFLTFINIESPTSHMNELFTTLKRIPVDVTVDSQQNFIACVLHGTTNETIEVIMRLKDYMTMQTTELIR